MRTHVPRISVVVLFAVAGSGLAIADVDLSVSDAQCFHRLIKDVGPRNGLECHFSGFPAWKLNGAEPSVPQEPEWHFVTPPETKDGLTTKLTQIVLRIRLEPTGKVKPKGFLFTWQEYDVVVASKADAKIKQQGSTATLIESLKNLGANASEVSTNDESRDRPRD